MKSTLRLVRGKSATKTSKSLNWKKSPPDWLASRSTPPHRKRTKSAHLSAGDEGARHRTRMAAMAGLGGILQRKTNVGEKIKSLELEYYQPTAIQTIHTLTRLY